MSEHLRESLSALMDDEAQELELERVLRNSEDGELRATWMRYHAVRRIIGGQGVESHRDLDISVAVREAIAGAELEDQPEPARWRNALRPVASFAVAASVFASVLVGGQLYGLVGQDSDTGVGLATRASPVGLVNTMGGSAVSATYGAPAIASELRSSGTDYNQLARQRLRQYMLPHAEQAALNAPQGMMPYARLAAYRGEEQ